MIFNSYLFWAFFSVVLLLYWALPHKPQRYLLLISSYLFYGAWDWRFLSLIAISTMVDFWVAQGIEHHQSSTTRKRLLIVSIVVNLGFLGFFKYFNFFTEEMFTMLQVVGISASRPTLSIILPVGISFYTFQTMGYTIDVFYRRIKPSTDLLGFAIFVCFFPQLVAGPIERYSNLMPQFNSRRQFSSNLISEGFYHVLIGMFKKVVVADNLAPIVNHVFNNSDQVAPMEVLVGLWAFAFQIYGDFSGYSSIAQGVARWMGFDLMYNFKMPYFATDPSDFWRRWHISLSQWLRDNLYIALGGNRSSRARTYTNLMLTMVIGGLWHGAAWTFVVWGTIHGALLCMARPFQKRLDAIKRKRRWAAWLPKAILMLLMFHAVCLTWLFFRADSLAQASSMLTSMFSQPWQLTQLAQYATAMLLFFALPLLLFEAWLERQRDMLALLKTSWVVRSAVYIYLVLMLLFFHPEASNAFIYFQF